ncbi:MAG TPA: heme-binding protein [Vicinamibacterales bacterium]|jgi:glc operon protein GlcG|nr:heme-binding protein [Vicinamibacterales bacterium]
MRRTLVFPALAAAVFLAAAASATAQSVTKASITRDGARRAIAAAVDAARLKQAPGAVIAVVDDGGNLVALERIDGTFAAGASISIGKARTAALFKKPTKAFEDTINGGRTAMAALPDAFFTPLQGGVPLVADGQIIGAIGVSGAASKEQDEELAIAGASALAKNDEGGKAPAVSYWRSAEVTAAFAKGAVLFDGEDGRNYMVHASHRDAAGMAEVHDLDADIIYVLDGTATFVTGGTAENLKTTAPNEARGSGIRSGETRHIARGDVLIVPKGTPHWFKEVSSPFNYYVVKVR